MKGEKGDQVDLPRHRTHESWGGRRGLNPRHSVPQTDALPAELLPPQVSSLARPYWTKKGRCDEC